MLVLHGFTSCPQSVRPLAHALAGAGYTVELPLLPGHGTTPDDMATTTWDDWAAGALSAYDELSARCDRVAVAGLSLGGALAALIAAERPSTAAVIAVNPGVEPPVAAVLEAITALADAGTERIDAVANDVADPSVRELAYESTPVACVLSLFDGQAKLVPRLADITCPVLIATSRQDHLVMNSSSELLASAVAGPVERLWLERSYHVATIDYDHELIEQTAVAFLARVLP